VVLAQETAKTCEGLVAVGGVGSGDGGVEGAQKLVLRGAVRLPGGEVAGVVGSDDAVGMGETVDGVEANVGAAVRVQDRREGGVAEVAGVAACVEVVGWLLEEHELQSSSAVEGLLGAAVVVGLEEGRKEYYMCALTKPHGLCRGSSGSDMHKQIKQNQNRDTKHPAA
jgi:hypothetical protein